MNQAYKMPQRETILVLSVVQYFSGVSVAGFTPSPLWEKMMLDADTMNTALLECIGKGCNSCK